MGIYTKPFNFNQESNNSNKILASKAVDGKKFLKLNASSIPGTYFRLS